ncbi:MAG: HEPN domain-containing protein [Candidatus Bipolaricaulia bacterium]
MPSPEESLYPADWLQIAEKDWKRVERLLDEDDPELAGFCLQQAVEKFLKAFLLFQGWQLRRIHNLDALLDDAITYDASLEEFRDVCQKISGFYFVERYPIVVETGIEEEDVRISWDQVRELVEKIRVQITHEEEESGGSSDDGELDDESVS